MNMIRTSQEKRAPGECRRAVTLVYDRRGMAQGFSEGFTLHAKADDVAYSQKPIGRRFREESELQDLVRDLNDGLVDPLIGGVKEAAIGDQALRERFGSLIYFQFFVPDCIQGASVRARQT